MKILIIGQGGREHALAWKAANSPLVETVFVAPGNGGTAYENKVQNVNIAVTNIDELVRFAKQNAIDLTIVGTEEALAKGIVDTFQNEKLACFGPSKQAAQLETSKSYCKEFLQAYGIPTARYASFSAIKPALNYINQQSFPIVIKADGLAAGKGVVIAENLIDAENTIRNMLNGVTFGEAGKQIVIEEFLEGYELSYIVMCDGQHILPLASSKDHKRLLDNDQGPNTGGMGAFSPVPLLTPKLEQIILNDIIQPTILAMNDMGTPYVGFLYAGLMITEDLQPKVLEFNCRLGDPETQPILMRLKSDLIELCLLALKGQLNQAKPEWDPRPALTVIMAAAGYPIESRMGDIIEGLENMNEMDGKIFHASTEKKDSHIISSGGRVLGVTALGNTLPLAQEKAYEMVNKIHWPHCHYRKDIGSQIVD